MDVFKAKRNAGSKNEDEDEPLEGRRVDVPEDVRSEEHPSLTHLCLDTIVPTRTTEIKYYLFITESFVYGI